MLGNYIGTDAHGQPRRAERRCGRACFTAAPVTISSARHAAGNLISGNLRRRNPAPGGRVPGVEFPVTDNQIAGNRIGSDASGTLPVPNNAGIRLDGPRTT